MSLIDSCPYKWDTLYNTVDEAYLTYCPSYAGVPQEVDEESDDDNKSVVEVFLAHSDELSGSEWFDCEPSVWLGIVAADLLGNRLSMYKLIRHAIDTSDKPADPEILEHLPLQVPVAYWNCSEALIAGELLRMQAEKLKHHRTARARRGGQARNQAFADAHAKFVEFYVKNTHLSRAEAARRFFRKLNDGLPPGSRPIYNSEESAVRALREALKKSGI